MDKGRRQGRHEPAGDHGLLLGRPHRLALCRPQPQALKAGVAWYGRLEGEPTALQPSYPLDLVKDIKAPILGLYGGQDQGIPVASVERMKTALAAAGNQSELGGLSGRAARLQCRLS